MSDAEDNGGLFDPHETHILTCARVDETPPWLRVQFDTQGGRRDRCSYCFDEIFISPGGTVLLEKESNTVVSCTHCAANVALAYNDGKPLLGMANPYMTEEEKRELDQSMPQEIRDLIINTLTADINRQIEEKKKDADS